MSEVRAKDKSGTILKITVSYLSLSGAMGAEVLSEVKPSLLAWA